MNKGTNFEEECKEIDPIGNDAAAYNQKSDDSYEAQIGQFIDIDE